MEYVQGYQVGTSYIKGESLCMEFGEDTNEVAILEMAEGTNPEEPWEAVVYVRKDELIRAVGFMLWRQTNGT